MTPKVIGIVGAVVALLLAGLLIRNQARVRPLQEELRHAGADRDRARAELQALEKRVASLSQQRDEDRAVMEELWGVVQRDRPKAVDRGGVEGSPSFGLSSVKAMVEANGGDLEAVVQQILTPERLESLLLQHPQEPGFWVAAALVCEDPDQRLEYLEKAATRFPESSIAQATLIEAKRVQPEADASTWAAIDNLRQADP